MISVLGIIEQRIDITSQWNYVNPIVNRYQAAWEYADDGLTPVGVKIGDGTNTWDDLPYWFVNPGVPPAIITKLAGVTLPINLASFQTSYSSYGRFPQFKFVKIIDNGDYTFSYQYLTDATVITTELIAGTPDSVSINVSNDGTDHLEDNILIIISI